MEQGQQGGEGAGSQQGAGSQGQQGQGQQGQGGQGEQVGAGGQQGQQQQQEPAWKKFDIPDNFKGETAEATLEKLFPAFKGYRDEQAKRGPVGKSPDEYQVDVGDKLKDFMPGKDAPIMQNFRAAAHKLGLTIQQAQGLIAEVYTPLAEKGLLAKNFDPQAEVDAIAKMIGKTGTEAKPAVEAVVKEAEAWSSNVGKQLGLSEAGQVEFESLALTAGGVEVLRALQSKLGAEKSFALGGQQAGALTREELHKMGEDPAIDPYSPNYDPAKRKAYDDGWNALRPKAG